MTILDVSVAKAQSPETESVSSLFYLREDSPVIVLLQKAKCGSTNRFLKSGPDVNPVQLNLCQIQASYFIRRNSWKP